MTQAMHSTQELLQALVLELTQDLEELTRRAQETAAGAVHEEARPEDDKDTRALEQTYLARGQAERVATASRALQIIESLRPAEFAHDQPIASTALVTIEDEEGVEKTVFLLPAAGGKKLELPHATVQVVTPSSPLGEGLLGKTEGDELEIRIGTKSRFWTVLAVR